MRKKIHKKSIFIFYYIKSCWYLAISREQKPSTVPRANYKISHSHAKKLFPAKPSEAISTRYQRNKMQGTALVLQTAYIQWTWRRRLSKTACRIASSLLLSSLQNRAQLDIEKLCRGWSFSQTWHTHKSKALCSQAQSCFFFQDENTSETTRSDSMVLFTYSWAEEIG